MEDQKIESQETQSETPKKELAPVKFYREHKKTIKDVLIGVAAGVVVDAAARDDRHIRPLADIKIVIHRLAKIAHRQQDGDMHRLIDHPGLNDDVDAVLILFGDDLYVGGGISRQKFSVFADVEAAFWYVMQPRDRL